MRHSITAVVGHPNVRGGLRILGDMVVLAFLLVAPVLIFRSVARVASWFPEQSVEILGIGIIFNVVGSLAYVAPVILRRSQCLLAWIRED